jgi:hypothetical protein
MIDEALVFPLTHGPIVIPDHIKNWQPKSDLGFTVLRALPYVPADLRLELIDRISRVAILETELRAKVIRGHGLLLAGLIDRRECMVEDYGVVSRRLVTNAGVGYIVDALQNLVEPELLKYHAIGTGTTAEAVGDTALVTELTTQYAPDNTRATGSQTEAAANIYQSVGTNTLDSGTPAVTEHMLTTQAATGGGICLDRSVFAAINLNGANGDGLQTDYRWTLNAGG